MNERKTDNKERERNEKVERKLLFCSSFFFFSVFFFVYCCASSLSPFLFFSTTLKKKKKEARLKSPKNYTGFEKKEETETIRISFFFLVEKISPLFPLYLLPWC
jgi:hypothetical protein